MRLMISKDCIGRPRVAMAPSSDHRWRHIEVPSSRRLREPRLLGSVIGPRAWLESVPEAGRSAGTRCAGTLRRCRGPWSARKWV